MFRVTGFENRRKGWSSLFRCWENNIKFWGKLGFKAGYDVGSEFKKNQEQTEKAENYYSYAANLGGRVKQLTQKMKDVEKKGKKRTF